MKSVLGKFIYFSKNIFILFSIFILTQPIKVSSIENEKNSKSLTLEETSKNESELKSEYILGVGDGIFIEFEGIPDYSQTYYINPEGYLELPEIRGIISEGLTLNELKEKLIIKYENYIVDPTFNLQILNYRPLKVYVSGAVNSPGLYTLEYIQQSVNVVKGDLTGVDLYPGIKENNKVTYFPTLFDALKLSNGVTNNADLSNITVIRNNSNTQGGGKIKAEINLLELITNGDQQKNIRLHDKDYIFVRKSENALKEQIIAINKTNLNPDIITVYITGNVIAPGQSEIKKGTSLVQAIASNGGTKILTGNIEFLRFNQDGVTKKSTFRYSQNAKINSERNPILMNGDIINVRKTLLGTTTEIFTDITSPIVSGYGLYSIVNEIIQ